MCTQKFTEIHHYFKNCFTLCNHFAVCLSKENFVPFQNFESELGTESGVKIFVYIQVT